MTSIYIQHMDYRGAYRIHERGEMIERQVREIAEHDEIVKSLLFDCFWTTLHIIHCLLYACT